MNRTIAFEIAYIIFLYILLIPVLIIMHVDASGVLDEFGAIAVWTLTTLVIVLNLFGTAYSIRRIMEEAKPIIRKKREEKLAEVKIKLAKIEEEIAPLKGKDDPESKDELDLNEKLLEHYQPEEKRLTKCLQRT